MDDIQRAKFFQVTPPRAILNNASWTTAAIDTAGFDYATVVFSLGATDIAITALKVQESDASGSGMADIDGLDMNGDTDIAGGTAALPSSTDDDNLVVFQVDLRGRKRYLNLVATIGNGSAGGFAAVIAILTKGAVYGGTIAEMGAETVLRV